MNLKVIHNGVEICAEAVFKPGQTPYYDNSFGNFLPGDPAELLLDPFTITIDARAATPQEIKEIENDSKLMLKFEEQAKEFVYNN